MRTSTIVSALGAASLVSAQRPNGTTPCDYYSNALFNSTDAATEYKLLTALVNTAVIGNYTDGAKVAVTGILNNGTVNGTEVSLLKYFDGMLASSNRGGSSGVAVNFLDGGAAEPLKMNMPANNTSSNQYFLLTHLYEYFGSLLGCSAYGKSGFPAYSGQKSQYAVHKFMDLSYAEVTYFIQQVGLAAESFGVTQADIKYIGDTLSAVFNVKCAANYTVIAAQGPAPQSICTAEDCPLAPNSSCAAYKDSVMPSAANSTNMFKGNASASGMDGSDAGGSSSTGSDSDSASGTDSSSAAESSSTSAAVTNTIGAALMAVAGLFALAAGL